MIVRRALRALRHLVMHSEYTLVGFIVYVVFMLLLVCDLVFAKGPV